MPSETDDFDETFPDFDPSSYEDMYPSLKDFPEPYWQVALQKVYDHELYAMARNSDIPQEYRDLARNAWMAIERGFVHDFVCDLAGQLLDHALHRNGDGALNPMRVSISLALMLWTGFRERGSSEWVQHVLHESIALIGDPENSSLTVEQAFAAGWAAGRADGEFEDKNTDRC